ncbi:MAG TPA: tryptophanase [Chitinophagales bacterium]|nr:tryptophanase [Chitinophagales bacterium]HNE46331.1 tryptophanase [Chitinophagales bacterium]HNF69345.1 tryptophanase [Chitinophagales bacterium]HNI53466.1 tryptophanase [Chitinophagales bacterium]HNM29561.1 tryptophanase [Chitinophagales bacterium]
MAFKTIIEPFRIKTVEPIKMSSVAERKKYLKAAHFNPFLLHSSQVIIDMLTDSGTSAMSQNQWAAIMQADESYAGAQSWERFYAAVSDLTGCEFVLPTHQGRAGERILYGYLGGKGKVFISNTHFDTTRANIEFSGAEAFDIPCKEADDFDSNHPFKGNMDVEKLEKLLKQHKKNVAAVIMTVTNNSGGGQPVSMANMESVSALCKKYKVLLILDCCRVAENAWFIRHKEPGFENMSYRDIAKKMFDMADGSVMSAKKDALVNMGGWLTLRDKKIADACMGLLIITEGFSTYGGLSGRDMEAVAVGIKEVFDDDYLNYRIKSTAYLGEHLRNNNIPIMYPTGGHAVYVDAAKLYPHIPVHQYPGQALACALYTIGGVRSVEIGSVMFGKYDNKKKLIPARHELVRLAIPRRVYTQSHIDYVIEVFREVEKNKLRAKGLKIIYEQAFLRHFTARFAEV